MHASNLAFSIILTLLLCSGNALAELEVHFIDVEQGGAVFVQKNNMNILYDCGDVKAGSIVTDYLGGLDIASIDLLIVSHAHKDHMGGCVHVLNNIEVKKVYHNGSKAKTKTWRQFLKTVTAKSDGHVLDQDINESDWLHIIVAYDRDEGRFGKESDNGILARVVDGQVKVLLTGDCEQACENELTQSSSVRSDVLGVGHHGSQYSSSTAFLSKVKPHIAVIQAGAGNQYGHPTAAALKRLKDAGVTSANLYRTDRQSSVVVLSDGQTVEVQTEK